MSIQRRFDLHLPGLLKVLAEHMYSSKRIGVRELIQNAHDSCVRREQEDDGASYKPAIKIYVKTRSGELIVEDNGSGMTEQELVEYLSTIGRGYTREMREQLSLNDMEAAAKLIGQFGIGFLSAFLLADHVKVLTRSYRGSPAILWQSKGDESYELAESNREQVGTTVTLKLKTAAAFLLQKDTLTEVVRSFADLLQIPIYWQDNREPINLMEAPWEANDVSQAIISFINRAFSDRSPLWVLPLKSTQIPIGDDSITIPMKGFLYIPNHSVASVREYGTMRVYIRRMFICENETDLLPPWAKFVRGVIDCPILQPTASREGLHQDDHFDLVSQAIEMQLVDELHQLSTDDPKRWKQLVRNHADLIMGWAVKEEDFFDQIKDVVVLRTSRGLLTLPEYLALTDDTIYYTTREMGSLQEQLLAEGQNAPAIDGSWFSVTPFLTKYVASHPHIKMVQLNGELESLLQPAPSKPFASVLAFFEDQRVTAKVVKFAPKEIPAILIYPPDAELFRSSVSSLENAETPNSVSLLLQTFVDDTKESKVDLDGVLYLNAACPFLQDFVASKPNPASFRSVMILIHRLAKLFAGQRLTTIETTTLFSDITRSLMDLSQ